MKNVASVGPAPVRRVPTAPVVTRRAGALLRGLVLVSTLVGVGHAQPPKPPRSTTGAPDTRPSAGPSASTPALNGWAFDIEISWAVAGMDAAARRDSVIAGRGYVAGLDARFDVKRSNDRDVPVGSWALSPDGGRSLFIVNPHSNRFYSLMNAISARAFMESKRISVQVVNLRVRGDTLGPCGTLDGRPMTCFRLLREYTVKARYFLFNQVVAVRESIDFWVTTELPGMSNPAAIYLADLTTFAGDDPAADLRAQQTRSRLFDGVPLKIVRVDIQSSEKTIPPNTAGDTTTIVLSGIARASVDRRMFDLPTNMRFRR
jgi:hypothetical protein